MRFCLKSEILELDVQVATNNNKSEILELDVQVATNNKRQILPGTAFKSQKQSPGGVLGKKKKGFLENFAKFTLKLAKYLCCSLFFNKVTDLKLATLLKKGKTGVFMCNFPKILRTTSFTWHLWWLLLKSARVAYIVYSVSTT